MNCRGFIVVFLSAFLPLAFSFLLYIAAILLSHLETSRKLHICRKSVLEIQTVYANAANKLVSLNNYALKLRLLRQKAEIALKVAITSANPIAIESAEIFLSSVKFKQRLLRIKQITIVGSAQSQSLKKLFETQRELTIQRNKKSDKTQIFYNTPSLHFKLSPANSDSPDYIPDFNFEKRQEISIQILTYPYLWFNSVTQYIFNYNSQNDRGELQFNCSATLTKGDNNKWRATIKRGKFLLNY